MIDDKKQYKRILKTIIEKECYIVEEAQDIGERSTFPMSWLFDFRRGMMDSVALDAYAELFLRPMGGMNLFKFLV